MDLLKHKNLLYPILLLFFVWGSLKMISMDMFLSYFLPYSNIERIAYESRLEIMNQLKSEVGSSKEMEYAIIFGTSKSSAFDPNLIREKTNFRNLRTYNFCAPAASVGFHHFWWKQILSFAEEKGNYPKFILIESDAYQLEERSTQISLDHAITPSYLIEDSFDRILNFETPNWEIEDIEYSAIKRIFPVFKYGIKVSAILKNLKKVKLEDGRTERIVNLKKEFSKEFFITTKEKHGSYPNQFIVNTPSHELNQKSKEAITSHFLNFKEKENQIRIFRLLLEEFSVLKIPTILYWPLFHPQLTEGLDKLPKIKKIKDKMITTALDIQMKNPDWILQISDPDKSGRLKCDSFVDPFHLSGGCFPELTNFIFKDSSKFLKN
ncbi:DUF1574 family protein [Leptospira sp. 201903070]|uniref:DUF1574 family protein n=1 Tax=Leptospira ainlahdjerensis TaxID=2810033 RepID=A0ABS2U880_9LEPT|nr:DUF1574 family protein [Leptospira ainlahdjerensis]MBM9576581.1 DUF1574 family protein [Leptospira ainlahdjerensis]